MAGNAHDDPIQSDGDGRITPTSRRRGRATPRRQAAPDSLQRFITELRDYKRVTFAGRRFITVGADDPLNVIGLFTKLSQTRGGVWNSLARLCRSTSFEDESEWLAEQLILALAATHRWHKRPLKSKDKMIQKTKEIWNLAHRLGAHMSLHHEFRGISSGDYWQQDDINGLVERLSSRPWTQGPMNKEAATHFVNEARQFFPGMRHLLQGLEAHADWLIQQYRPLTAKRFRDVSYFFNWLCVSLLSRYQDESANQLAKIIAAVTEVAYPAHGYGDLTEAVKGQIQDLRAKNKNRAGTQFANPV